MDEIREVAAWIFALLGAAFGLWMCGYLAYLCIQTLTGDSPSTKEIIKERREERAKSQNSGPED